MTSFTYRLHPLGSVLAGGVTFAPERARDAMRFYHEFASTSPDELSTAGSLSLGADGRPVFAVGVCWSGSLSSGERALAPLRSYGPPTADSIVPRHRYARHAIVRPP